MLLSFPVSKSFTIYAHDGATAISQFHFCIRHIAVYQSGLPERRAAFVVASYFIRNIAPPQHRAAAARDAGPASQSPFSSFIRFRHFRGL